MGASSSTVTAGIKNQVDGRSNAIYQLADVTGNGVLAKVAKEALRSNDMTEIDKQIRDKVRPFLYNNGDGAELPIQEVITQRHKERKGTEFSPTGQVPAMLMKFVCWRLDARGAVGETLLHVCFLSGLMDHMKLLAQRLIYCFPKTINDFYICDEYYGETVLHMGIVSENPEMVRFLLKCGADVSQRCSGNFFTCDDQKSTREDKWDSEHAMLSRHTSFTGHLYWGEYPLAFAACLSQVACFRMLCAHGADPNWQDSNLNTVLHICTIRENWPMFELALSQGANLHINNRLGLTPLTLAAYLAKKQMFEHIVEEEREVHWTYGGVMSAAYPLEHLDSIEPSTGKVNRNSALAIVVYGNSSEHLSLLPNLLEHLVHRKWETYGHNVLFGQLAIFLTYFTLVFVCFLMRPTPLERETKVGSLICFLNLSESWNNMTLKSTFYAVLNILVVICAALYLLQMYNHIRNVGRAMYFLSLSGFPAKAIFLMSCGLMLSGFLLRIFCFDNSEDMVWIVTVLLTALKFLFFCRGFKSVGPFVMMLYKIILRDLIRFFLIYFIIVIGFSQSFYIIFLGFRRTDKTFKIEEEGTIMYSIGETFIRMFIMSLTEFGVLFEQLEQCELGLIGKITFIIYMLLVTMLLINLLIAMMTNTYTEVSANSLEWLRQWSAIILMMEQSFDPKTRLKYQKMYSIPMEDGKHIALLMKLSMSESEQENRRQKIKKQRQTFREQTQRGF